MRNLELRLLGHPRVMLDGKDRTAEIGAKSLALVAFVALAAPQQIARGKLAGAFWPDKSEDTSLYRLRHVLWDLRRILGKTHLQSDDAACWLDLSNTWVDVLEFRDGCAGLRRLPPAAENAARAAALVELYRGDLLESVVVRQAPIFDEWLLVERERLQLLYQDALWYLAQTQQAAADYASAARTLARLVEADPLRERSYRALMGVHFRQGDRAAALRVYQQCATTLAAELGVAPSSETQLLREMIAQNNAPTVEERLQHIAGLIQRKQYAEARAACTALQAIAAEPITASRLALLRAEIALLEGKRDEALALIRSISQLVNQAIRD